MSLWRGKKQLEVIEGISKGGARGRKSLRLDRKKSFALKKWRSL